MSSTKPWMRFGGAAGLVASGLVAGGVLAGTLTANAAEDPATTGTESSTSRPAEELLTGDTKTQVEAAVLAEYPGATIERTESDSGGVHESHIVTADGERLTVLVGWGTPILAHRAARRGPPLRGTPMTSGRRSQPPPSSRPNSERHTARPGPYRGVPR